MGNKKPKKDEVITLEGIVNDITSTLIQVDTHNIAVLGDVVKRVSSLDLNVGDKVMVTYKNGILLTIEITVKKPKEMHIDKTEEVKPIEPVTSELTVEESNIGREQTLPPASPDIHIQKYPKCPFCGTDAVRWVAPIGDCWSRKEIRLVFTLEAAESPRTLVVG